MKNFLIIILIFSLCYIFTLFIPNTNNDVVTNDELYISEIMSVNSYTISDEDGEYSDYIEIYNNSNYNINLKNYYLSDDESNIKKWKFPDVIIKSKEYLVIFASAKDKTGVNIHTNFKLSSKGEVLILTDISGNIINKFRFPALNNDTSYGYIKNSYGILEKPSPGDYNGNSFYSDISNKTYSLVFNEYVSHNDANSYNSFGYYYDWVEIYNNSSEEVELNNLYLSDNKKKLGKYKLPNVSIEAYDYLVIYFSGNASYSNNEIHANFKLSDGEELYLSDGREIIDSIKLVDLVDDVSYGIKDSKWCYFYSPTPGSKNDTKCYDSLGGL